MSPQISRIVISKTSELCIADTVLVKNFSVHGEKWLSSIILRRDDRCHSRSGPPEALGLLVNKLYTLGLFEPMTA